MIIKPYGKMDKYFHVSKKSYVQVAFKNFKFLSLIIDIFGLWFTFNLRHGNIVSTLKVLFVHRKKCILKLSIYTRHLF